MLRISLLGFTFECNFSSLYVRLPFIGAGYVSTGPELNSWEWARRAR